MRLRRFLLRTWAMAGKETLHILREPRFLYLALGMPVVMIVIFGYGVSFDLERLALGVLDESNTPGSRRLVEAFTSSEVFRIAGRISSADEAERQLRRAAVKGVLVIPPDLGRTLARGEGGSVQLLLDGADSTTAGIALGYGRAIGRSASLAMEGGAGKRLEIPLQAEVRVRFNQAVRSTHFTIPGLVAVILSVMGVLLTALTVAREWEQGSMEQLFTTPVGRLSIVLGKLIPYFVIGLLQWLLVLGLGAALFDIPLRGSLAQLLLLSILFILGVLGQGLLISVIARTQSVAMQVGAISGMLPSLLISGFMFPLENMPPVLQALSTVVPARYYISALRGVLLKGVGLEVLWPEALALLAYALIMILLSTLRFQRRLLP